MLRALLELAPRAWRFLPRSLREDATIDRLIDHNRATPRPGMARRDDDLMREAERRARAKHKPETC